jgi:hypothetical protein
MRCRYFLSGICVAGVLASFLACGDGTGPKPKDEAIEDDVADVDEDFIDDDGLASDGDVIPDDKEGTTDDGVGPENPIDEDVLPNETTDDGTACEGDCEDADDVPDIETVEAICPCSETPEFPVCGMDNKTTFKNDTCARCAQCNDCPGCPPGNPLKCGDDVNNWVLYKAACGECAKVCDKATWCELIFVTEDQCNEVCGFEADADGKPLSTNKTYADVCELIQAFKCVDFQTVPDKQKTSWADRIVQLGECVMACAPCAGEAVDWVCGDDGNSYPNVCTLKNCPLVSGVKLAYLGHCLGGGYCDQCAGQAKAEVCADDGSPYGATYANQCAAATCKGLDVKWTGKCCPECKLTGTPACGQDGTPYPNDCFLTECLGKPACPQTGAGVCGKKGNTYPNQCQADCFDGGVLHTGACVGICEQCPKTLDPKCGTMPGGLVRSFQNQCFADCLGGTVTSNGWCADSCTAICGTIEAPNLDPAYTKPACGDDKITYPTSCFPTKCLNEGFTAGACS